MNHLSSEELLALVKNWAENRQLYPGWLIAPKRNRELLWQHNTEWWLDTVVRLSPTLKPEDQLFVLEEFNWRLETALLPMFDNLAIAVVSTLNCINPFPKDLGNADAPVQAVDINGEQLGRLREQWLRLALALVRYYREERKFDDFDAWTKQLDLIAKSFPHIQPGLSYERCLRALCLMDDVLVRTELQRWAPLTGDDPMWQVRKGAILVEIGELKKGEEVVAGAIAKMRQTFRQVSLNTAVLTREAWALSFMRQIRFQNALGTPEWNQVSAYDADRIHPYDPDSMIDELEKDVLQPLPEKRSSTTRQVKFQPGTSSVTRHVGGEVDARRIAIYQYMRLIEEVGRPPRLDSVVISEESLVNAVAWFTRFDQVRCRSLLCRLASEKASEEYLNRHRVAALSEEAIDDLFAVGRKALTACQTRIPLAADAEKIAVANRAIRQLAAAVDILARVCIRRPDRLLDLLKEAMSLYRADVFRATLNLREPLENLFESLILAMKQEDLNASVIDIVSLPIPGSTEFPVNIPDRWPDLERALRKREWTVPEKPSGLEWRRVVGSILKAAESENALVRGHAVIRLALFAERGWLSQGSKKRMATVLWAQREPGTQLPFVYGLQKWSFLLLPEPSDGLAAQLFQKYLRESDLIRFGQKSIGADGKEQWQYTFYVNANGFLIDWLSLDKGMNPEGRCEERMDLQWDESDYSNLFLKMATWWNDEGKKLAGQQSTNPFFDSSFRDAARTRLRYILEVIRRILAPNVAPETELASRMVNFVEELRQSHIPVERALPSLLQYRPELTDDAVSRIRRALASSDDETYHSGLDGLIFWLRRPKRYKGRDHQSYVPEPPQEILADLGFIVSGRRQPGLDLALSAVIAVMRDLPDTVTEDFVRSVSIGLEYLHGETAYRLDDIANENIPYKDVPNYRRMAAIIAGLLSQRGIKTEIVKEWLTEAKIDPLPEIRRAMEAFLSSE